MPITKFEESIAWQKSRNGAKEIYTHFVNHQDFGFRNQICRAAVSSMNNIAEGFSRTSPKDLRRFVEIAKGSADEVKSMLYLAQDLEYIDRAKAEELRETYDEIGRIQKGLAKAIKVK